MSLEENNAAIQRFFDEFANKGEMSVADKLVSGNFVMHTSSGADIEGVEAVKRAYSALATSFPDNSYTVDDMVAEGDNVPPSLN